MIKTNKSISDMNSLKIAVLQGWCPDFVRYKEDVLFVFDKYLSLLEKELPNKEKVNIYTHTKANLLFCSYYYNDLYLFSVQANNFEKSSWTIDTENTININDIVIYCLSNYHLDTSFDKEVQYICDVFKHPNKYSFRIQNFVNKHYLNDKQKLFSLNCLYSIK